MVHERDHSAMLRPSAGTGCQTSFTKQKTLLLFGGSWNHICFQIVTSLSSFPHPVLLLLLPFPMSSSTYLPLPPFLFLFYFFSSLPNATSKRFSAWSETALYKWTLTLTMRMSVDSFQDRVKLNIKESVLFGTLLLMEIHEKSNLKQKVVWHPLNKWKEL